jgi:hypothetical protein
MVTSGLSLGPDKLCLTWRYQEDEFVEEGYLVESLLKPSVPAGPGKPSSYPRSQELYNVRAGILYSETLNQGSMSSFHACSGFISPMTTIPFPIP